MISILIVIYIVFISLGLPDSLFGVSWPVVHTEFGIAESFASIYSIVTGICSGGASFLAGVLLRKFGTARVTFVSILFTAIGLLGISIAPNIWIMMLFTIVLSYGAGAIDTGLNNYVSLHYKSRHMNWLHCFWGVGVTISPLIMSRFLSGETGSWRSGYRAIALIQLGIAVIVAFTLKKWRSVDKQQEKTEAESTKGSLKEIFKIKGVITSILSQGFYCSMEFLIGTWGASYLVNSYGAFPDTAAKWVSLYYGGIMLGRLLSGFISLKADDKTLIRGGIAASFVGMILLALPIGTVSFVGLLLIGVGFGPIFPSILHSVPERFGKKYSADITGFHMGGAYAIGFGVQLAFGYIATATTFNITPYVLLGFVVALFTVNEITLKKVKNRGQKNEIGFNS